MNQLRLLGVVLCLASGCDAEPDPPTVDEATPQEAAQTVSDVSCDKAAACGYITASCTACAVGEPDCEPQCTVKHQPYTAAECFEDVEDDLVQGFACQDLTSDEVGLVDECLAAIPGVDCPSVEDVQAWVDGGRQGRDPRDPIEACDVVFNDIIYRCEEGE